MRAPLILALLLSGCTGGVLDPHGPVAGAERTILFDATVIMLAVVVPVIFGSLLSRGGFAPATNGRSASRSGLTAAVSRSWCGRSRRWSLYFSAASVGSAHTTWIRRCACTLLPRRWKSRWGRSIGNGFSFIPLRVRIGVMYVILPLIMLVRGFSDAIMMRTQLALAAGTAAGYLPPDHRLSLLYE